MKIVYLKKIVKDLIFEHLLLPLPLGKLSKMPTDVLDFFFRKGAMVRVVTGWIHGWHLKMVSFFSGVGGFAENTIMITVITLKKITFFLNIWYHFSVMLTWLDVS